MKGYSKVPWILMGISVILLGSSDGDNLFLGLLALITFIVGGVPASIQCTNVEKNKLINKINEGLYKLGFTTYEVNKRQNELKIKKKKELKKLDKEVEIKLKEQEKRAFFEPIYK